MQMVALMFSCNLDGGMLLHNGFITGINRRQAHSP
jgi:hypothetical protein